MNRLEENVEGQATANGKVEHVFYAFLATVSIVEMKWDLEERRREQLVAQIIA